MEQMLEEYGIGFILILLGIAVIRVLSDIFYML